MELKIGNSSLDLKIGSPSNTPNLRITSAYEKEVGGRGYSAYEIAVQEGFVGTEEEWLDSLVGPQGPKGEVGPPGQGEPGPQGPPGIQGEDGFSPTATVTKSGKVATITITDKNGTTTATVSDGEGGSGGSSEWGSITGDIADQTDLKNALDAKADTSDIPTKTSDLTNDSGFIDNTYHDNTKQDKIDSTHKLSSDLVDDTNNTNKFVTANEKTAWNNKGTYSKPSGGIPKTDLASEVQTSLGKADTAIQPSNTSGLIKNDGTVDTTSYSTFSGNYNDLTNKPTIPDELSDLSDDSTHRLVTDTEKNTWNNKADASALATVATSGSYNDLTNKPTIPTVNNATLTIQKNGSNVATFTANASSNATANITVPTKTSDLNNDSGFIDNNVNNLVNYFKKSDGALPVYHIDAEQYNTSQTAFDFSGKPSGLYIIKGADSLITNKKFYIKPRNTATSSLEIKQGLFTFIYITSVIPDSYTTLTTHYLLRIDEKGDFDSTTIKDNGSSFSLGGSIYGVSFVTTDQTQTISGVKTFSTLPKSSVTPTDADHLVRKGYVDDMTTYSTNEIRIGTWIDGKPLYRKVISATTPSSSDYEALASNVAILVNAYGYIYYDGTNARPINMMGINQSSSYFRLDFAGSNNRIYSNFTSDLRSKNYVLVLEYTKTTD